MQFNYGRIILGSICLCMYAESGDWLFVRKQVFGNNVTSQETFSHIYSNQLIIPDNYSETMRIFVSTTSTVSSLLTISYYMLRIIHIIGRQNCNLWFSMFQKHSRTYIRNFLDKAHKNVCEYASFTEIRIIFEWNNICGKIWWFDIASLLIWYMPL